MKKNILRKLILEFMKENPGTQYNGIMRGVEELTKKHDIFPPEAECKENRIDFSFYRDKRLNPIDELNINEIIWDLIIERILTVGRDNSNENWPWLRLTKFGENVIKNDMSGKYYSPEDYIFAIKEIVPDINPIIEQYLIEGLNCYKRRLFFAASVVSLTDLYIWALRGVLTTKQSRPKNRDCHAPFGRSQ